MKMRKCGNLLISNGFISFMYKSKESLHCRLIFCKMVLNGRWRVRKTFFFLSRIKALTVTWWYQIWRKGFNIKLLKRWFNQNQIGAGLTENRIFVAFHKEYTRLFVYINHHTIYIKIPNYKALKFHPTFEQFN